MWRHNPFINGFYIGCEVKIKNSSKMIGFWATLRAIINPRWGFFAIKIEQNKPKEFSLGDLNIRGGGASDLSYDILKLLQLKINLSQQRVVFSVELLSLCSFKCQLQILRVGDFFTKLFYDMSSIRHHHYLDIFCQP